jgi:hypothetical protein
MKFIIYKHTNTITKKSYIGYTSSTLEKRLNRHFQDAKRGSNQYFHRAIRKYGQDCWISEILAECEIIQQAHKLECSLILEHNTFGINGYNMTIGGEGTTGRIVSEESRQRLRAQHLNFRHTTKSKQTMVEKFTILRGRKVNQYTKSGQYIATYDSCTQAAQQVLNNKNLSGSIHQLCAGTFSNWNQELVKGFQWKFDNLDNRTDVSPIVGLKDTHIKNLVKRNSQQAKKVQQLSTNDELISSYTSAKEASLLTGIYISGIQRCCIGRLLTAGGYKWAYIN